jgi:phenylacetate-coenzyme A ligase PaaK-like adenylate-forming protein
MTQGSFERFRDEFQTGLLSAMPAAIDRVGWGAPRLAARQEEGLRRLLAAAMVSPFHRRRLAGIEPEPVTLADLPRIPVMTKAEMMADLDGVFTDRRLSAGLAEEALGRTADVPVPILDDYFALSSGGSSGCRGVFVFDRTAAVDFIACLMRALASRMAAGGGAPPGGLTIAMVCAPCAVHATGAAPAMTEGPRMPFRFVGVPATLPLAEIVYRLNALDPPALTGYPTVLALLARERRAGRLRIAPRSVSCTSETLSPELRAAIAEGFGVPIVDQFGSTEGLVGVSAPDDDVLVFNSDMCIVELVDEANSPVPQGEASARVLVTNLSNRVQPLIRYAMEDSFLRLPDAERHGHLRARVRGRSDEVLRYGGVDIHPIVIRGALARERRVFDYQVRQTPRGVDVAVLAAEDFETAPLCRALVAALGKAGLADPLVTLDTVPTLDRNQGTGKLRRFIPLSELLPPGRQPGGGDAVAAAG